MSVDEKQVNIFVKTGQEVVLFIKENLQATIVTMVLAFMVALFYLGFRYMTITLDRMSREVTEIKQEVVIDESSNFTEISAMNHGVDTLLDDLIEDNEAQRAKIFIFHNGKRSLNGINFYYAEATNERTAPGIASTILNFGQMPSSIFSEFAPLLAEDNWRCIATSDIRDSALRGLLEDQGSNSTCIYPLKDDSGIFGFISVNYAVYSGKMENIDYGYYLKNIRTAAKIEELMLQ